MAARPCTRFLHPLYNSVRRVFPSTASSGLSTAPFAASRQALTQPQWRSRPCAFLFRSGTGVPRHSWLLTPHTRPVALGSADGCSVRQPLRLLWPHPSFWSPPSVYGLCRRLSDGQKVPNLLSQSLIACRRPYSGGSHSCDNEFHERLGLHPSCRGSATAWSPASRIRRGSV